MAALEATGFALVSSTRLRDRYAIRMCILNHTTRREDVERTVRFLETAAVGVAALAILRDAEPGETIIEQWDVSREFYVVISGKLEANVDGRRVRELGAGDIFGEIAAMDWTRGYGYPRTASVVATEATRLVVFPEATVNKLVQRFPEVRRRVIATMHERLPTE